MSGGDGRSTTFSRFWSARSCSGTSGCASICGWRRSTSSITPILWAIAGRTATARRRVPASGSRWWGSPINCRRGRCSLRWGPVFDGYSGGDGHRRGNALGAELFAAAGGTEVVGLLAHPFLDGRCGGDIGAAHRIFFKLPAGGDRGAARRRPLGTAHRRLKKRSGEDPDRRPHHADHQHGDDGFEDQPQNHFFVFLYVVSMLWPSEASMALAVSASLPLG